jgi:hypothetical protein
MKRGCNFHWSFLKGMTCKIEDESKITEGSGKKTVLSENFT